MQHFISPETSQTTVSSEDNPNSHQLWIRCSEDINNNGDWLNQKTTLVGDQDQKISLLYDQPIDGQVVFNSEISSPYQWYYNNGILDSPDFNGETQTNLEWLVPVSDAWYGNFYCNSTPANSRNFSVQGKYPVYIDATAFLEGPFDGTEMNTTLNNNDLLPLNQPYNQAPWNYAGTESVTEIPNSDMVDWVLVELRDAPDAASATPATTVAQQAVFLLKDGSLVDIDGNSRIYFNQPFQYNIFMVLIHRNHLNILSATIWLMLMAFMSTISHQHVNQVYGGMMHIKNCARHLGHDRRGCQCRRHHQRI